MLKYLIIFTFISSLIMSCGKGTVTIDESQYKPKIVVDGYLQPGHPVDKIYIWRNFQVNQNLENFDIVLDDADVWITDISENQSYRLSYYPDSAWFRYIGSDLTIRYGQQYRLDVSAVIEGKNLTASSITNIPNPGLKIININYDTLLYRQHDKSDNIINFNINFERSPGTDFYAIAIIPVFADLDSFIYNNPFGDISREDVEENIEDFNFRYNWIQNTPLTPGQSNIELFWFDLWFYGEYRAVLYAADINYQHFIQTYASLKEQDGNYHEPIMHFEGDGIGVFGSVVADTIRIYVKRS